MIRKAKAVWRGTGRDGNGNLSTDSGVLVAHTSRHLPGERRSPLGAPSPTAHQPHDRDHRQDHRQCDQSVGPSEYHGMPGGSGSSDDDRLSGHSDPPQVPFICRRDSDRVRVFSRTGHDWSRALPAIVAAKQALPVRSVGGRRTTLRDG
jgi:hypothetical protein